jgi:uncharacterized ferritin-like protein (DUF455 family)
VDDRKNLPDHETLNAANSQQPKTRFGKFTEKKLLYQLLSAGDKRGAEILAIILRDEIGHVATGNRWYRWLCSQRGLDPIATYKALTEQYSAPRLRGPFNLEARRAAGFDEEELAALRE